MGGFFGVKPNKRYTPRKAWSHPEMIPPKRTRQERFVDAVFNRFPHALDQRRRLANYRAVSFLFVVLFVLFGTKLASGFPQLAPYPPGLKDGPAPSGIITVDQANLNSAMTSIGNGGTLGLQAGTYQVQSFGRTDTVSVSSGANVWTDASMTAADVARAAAGNFYVLARTGNIRVARIVSVTVGTGFTTDINSGANIVSGSAQLIVPALVAPYGVTISGVARFATNGTTGTDATSRNFSIGTANVVTKIVDTGTGVTILSVGSQSYGGDGLYLQKVAIWGSTGGGTGNTICGVWLGDNNWFAEMERVDFSWHGTAGLIMDANLNGLDSRNSSYQNNGTVSATTPTGGALLSFYQSQTSAGINFYNDFFFGNNGMAVGGGPINGGLGKVASLQNSQVANTNQTSFSPYSGWGIVLASNLAYGTSNLINVWAGTNALGDLWFNTGSLAAINSIFTSPVTNCITNYGALTLIGCHLYATSANAVAQNGTINWDTVTLENPGVLLNLYSGGPNVADSLGQGSSAALTSSGGGVSPGAFGTSANISAAETISAATFASTLITATVVSTTGMFAGQQVVVAGFTGTWTSANGTWQVNQVLSTTQFTFFVSVAPSGAFTGSPTATFGTANRIWNGTGVPSNNAGQNGDYYLRQDGGASAHVYFKATGTWSALV